MEYPTHEQIEKKVCHQINWKAFNKKKHTMHPAPIWETVGGRTLFWGGLATRFIPNDFSDWDLSYEDILPYYLEAEQLIHVKSLIQSGTQTQLIAALQSQGFAATEAPIALDSGDGKTDSMFRFDSSIARLTKSGLLEPVHATQGISLIYNAKVVSLTQSSGKVTSIHIRSKNTEPAFMANVGNSHVILACGALQSNILMQNSNIHIHNKIFSRYMSDHLFFQAIIRLKQPIDGACYLFIPSDSTNKFQFQIKGPYQKMSFNPLFHSSVSSWTDWKSTGKYLLLYCFGKRDAIFENKMNKRNGHSNIDTITCHYTQQDYQRCTKISDKINDIAHALHGRVEELKTYGPGQSLHDMGGLRMASSLASGATDSYGNVYGIENVSIVDASIWPTQGAASPYLTITALALRLADYLLKRSRCSLRALA
ncbi:MAG: GMC oxidoreductase [Legionellaceae bacterium]|nr:GMC oxidoreductase [Legionellaceae bacterium]